MVSQINDILNIFKPITLEQMDSVNFMNRLDTKFFFHVSLLPEILKQSANNFFVLEIKEKRQFNYNSTYFDTPDFLMYNNHLNRRCNRYKIRQRRYDITGVEFFEVKYKNNKGRTLKSRFENTSPTPLNKKADDFLKLNTPYSVGMLQATLKNEFTRVTLVNYELCARITLDYNLSFSENGTIISLPNMGIAEVKQDGICGNSFFINLMRQLGQRPSSISKYCTGAALLFPNLKTNTIKSKLIQINKLHHYGFDISRKC